YAVSPNRGSTLGGTSVTIYGTGLAGATSIAFGTSSVLLNGFFLNDTQLYVQSPPGAAGAVDVTVTTAAGTSARQTADRFTYATPGPPVINAVAPNRGSSAGGTQVRLFGSSFTNTTAVSFGGAGALGWFNSGDSELDVTSPAAAVGTVDITVATPFGTST